MNTKNFSLSLLFAACLLFAFAGTSLADHHATAEVQRTSTSAPAPKPMAAAVITKEDGTQCLNVKAAKKKVRELKRSVKKDIRERKKTARADYRAKLKEVRGDKEARKALREAYKAKRIALRNENKELRKLRTLAGYKAKGYIKENYLQACNAK